MNGIMSTNEFKYSYEHIISIENLLPDHRVLRITTKKRMIGRLEAEPNDAVTASYRGLLGHGNAKKLEWRYLP